MTSKKATVVIDDKELGRSLLMFSKPLRESPGTNKVQIACAEYHLAYLTRWIDKTVLKQLQLKQRDDPNIY